MEKFSTDIDQFSKNINKLSCNMDRSTDNLGKNLKNMDYWTASMIKFSNQLDNFTFQQKYVSNINRFLLVFGFLLTLLCVDRVY